MIAATGAAQEGAKRQHVDGRAGVAGSMVLDHGPAWSLVRSPLRVGEQLAEKKKMLAKAFSRDVSTNVSIYCQHGSVRAHSTVLMDACPKLFGLEGKDMFITYQDGIKIAAVRAFVEWVYLGDAPPLCLSHPCVEPALLDRVQFMLSPPKHLPHGLTETGWVFSSCVGHAGEESAAADGRQLWYLARKFPVAGIFDWLVESVDCLNFNAVQRFAEGLEGGDKDRLEKACDRASLQGCDMDAASLARLDPGDLKQLVGMIVEGVDSTGKGKRAERAFSLIRRWFKSNPRRLDAGREAHDLVSSLDFADVRSSTLWGGMLRGSGVVSDEKILQLWAARGGDEVNNAELLAMYEAKCGESDADRIRAYRAGGVVLGDVLIDVLERKWKGEDAAVGQQRGAAVDWMVVESQEEVEEELDIGRVEEEGDVRGDEEERNVGGGGEDTGVRSAGDTGDYVLLQVFNKQTVNRGNFNRIGDVAVWRGRGKKELGLMWTSADEVNEKDNMPYAKHCGGFQKARAGEGPVLENSLGMAFHPTSREVFVTNDGRHPLIRFDTAGYINLVDLALVGRGEGEFRKPRGVAFGHDGEDLYVVDAGNYRVQVLRLAAGRRGRGTALEFVRAFGSEGQGEGQFGPNMTHLGVWEDGWVAVADGGNARVQVFDGEGRFIRSVGPIVGGREVLRRPYGIAVGPHGELWVSDSELNVVVEFNQEGEVLGVVGGRDEDAVRFDRPRGLAVDWEGGLYVSSEGECQIKKIGRV